MYAASGASASAEAAGRARISWRWCTSPLACGAVGAAVRRCTSCHGTRGGGPRQRARQRSRTLARGRLARGAPGPRARWGRTIAARARARVRVRLWAPAGLATAHANVGLARGPATAHAWVHPRRRSRGATRGASWCSTGVSFLSAGGRTGGCTVICCQLTFYLPQLTVGGRWYLGSESSGAAPAMLMPSAGMGRGERAGVGACGQTPGCITLSGHPPPVLHCKPVSSPSPCPQAHLTPPHAAARRSAHPTPSTHSLPTDCLTLLAGVRGSSLIRLKSSRIPSPRRDGSRRDGTAEYSDSDLGPAPSPLGS
jgi:hypothetical protein